MIAAGVDSRAPAAMMCGLEGDGQAADQKEENHELRHGSNPSSG